ncbi:MAG TPA: TolC family protein [Vicinamibacteria bacterium]
MGIWRVAVSAGALSLLLTSAGAQEPPPSEDEPAAVAEEVAGPAPGVPTVTLGQAVGVALKKNYGLLSSADGVQSARINYTTARAQFYPQLIPSYSRASGESSFGLEASQRLPWTGGSLSASALMRSLPGTDLAVSRSTGVQFVLRQPLLRGFGPNSAHYTLRNSRRGQQAQERAYELSRQRLAVDVARSFYQIVQQRQLLTVSRQSLTRSQSLLKASEARLAVGLVSKLDVFRAELQASQAQDAMVRSQAALETALEQFRVLLGLPPTEPLEPEAVDLREELTDEAEPLEALLDRARSRRLELQEGRDQIDDAQRSVSLARQNLLPQLDLNLGFTQGGLGTTFTNAFSLDRRVNLYFSASYPVERSSERANKAVAEIEVAARTRGVRQQELQVEGEVRAALRELERIRKSVDLQKKGVEVAEQQRRLATLRYQRGLASNFDVVDAEGSLVLARSALVNLLTSYQVARIELMRVTGGLDVDTEFK